MAEFAATETKLLTHLDDATIFWNLQDSTELRTNLREALAEIAVMTMFQTISKTVNTVATTRTYILDADMIVVLEVLRGTAPLEKVSIRELSELKPTWIAEDAAPTHWFPFGLTKIGLYPRPVGAEALTTVGAGLSVEAGAPLAFNLPDESLLGVIAYAEHISRFKEGGLEFRASFRQLQDFVDAARVLTIKLGTQQVHDSYAEALKLAGAA